LIQFNTDQLKVQDEGAATQRQFGIRFRGARHALNDLKLPKTDLAPYPLVKQGRALRDSLIPTHS
jgi:hypothetical protein